MFEFERPHEDLYIDHDWDDEYDYGMPDQDFDDGWYEDDYDYLDEEDEELPYGES